MDLEVEIDDAKKLKRILDTDFADRVEKIAKRVFSNYVSEKEVIPFRGPYVSAVIRVDFYNTDVTGKVVLNESGLYSDMEAFNDKKDEYVMRVAQDSSFSVSFPPQEHDILPSRIVEHQKAVFSAIESAVKDETTQPTRCLPTNMDTMTKLDRWKVDDKVGKKLLDVGYKFKDPIFYHWAILDIAIEDKEKHTLAIDVNPLKGRVRRENGMDGYTLNGNICNQFLNELHKKCLNMEQLALEGMLEFVPTNLDDVQELARLKEMASKQLISVPSN